MSTQSDPLRITAQELHSKYTHLVVSGCSFSAGDSLIDNAYTNPTTWSHWLLKKIHFDRYANLAIPGGGNLAAAANLLYYLETQFCDPTSALVIFNLTEFDRIDTICPFDHPDSNKNFSWAKNFDFSWLTEGSFLIKRSPFYGKLQTNIGYEQILIFNSLIIMALLDFLESRRFRYYYMAMNQQCLDHASEFLKSRMQHNKSRFIDFFNGQNMQEYVEDLGLTVSQIDHHPSSAGHQKISEVIFEKIKNDL